MFRQCFLSDIFMISGRSAVIFPIFAPSPSQANEIDSIFSAVVAFVIKNTYQT